MTQKLSHTIDNVERSSHEDENELLILAASKHVTAAWSQRTTANEAVERAKHDPDIITLTMDYCQNLSLSTYM